jgi:hypothetical protein
MSSTPPQPDVRYSFAGRKLLLIEETALAIYQPSLRHRGTWTVCLENKEAASAAAQRLNNSWMGGHQISAVRLPNIRRGGHIDAEGIDRRFVIRTPLSAQRLGPRRADSKSYSGQCVGFFGLSRNVQPGHILGLLERLRFAPVRDMDRVRNLDGSRTSGEEYVHRITVYALVLASRRGADCGEQTGQPSSNARRPAGQSLRSVQGGADPQPDHAHGGAAADVDEGRRPVVTSGPGAQDRSKLLGHRKERTPGDAAQRWEQKRIPSNVGSS